MTVFNNRSGEWGGDCAPSAARTKIKKILKQKNHLTADHELLPSNRTQPITESLYTL